MKKIWMIIIFSAISGGTVFASKDTPMRILASQLTELTTVASVYTGADRNSSSRQSAKPWLKNAIQGTAVSLKPFDNFNIYSHWNKDNLILLVCNQESTHALIEDSSCGSADVEKPLWQNKKAPCQFSPDSVDLCH